MRVFHYPNLKKNLLEQCLKHFYALRTLTKLRKMPSTSELLDWIGVLLKSGITLDELKKGVPFLGTLIKKEKSLEEIKLEFEKEEARLVESIYNEITGSRM